MFKDYYSILGVSENVEQQEIKFAFKKQAIKWHPDKNNGVDTTQRMQEINEAYLILKDREARCRYDIEYQRFKEYQRQKDKEFEAQFQKQKESEQHRQTQKENNAYEQSNKYSNFKVNDDILNKWMDNAKRQAVDLAKQSIEDLAGMVTAGTKAAVTEAGSYLIYYILISVIVFIVINIIKSINN